MKVRNITIFLTLMFITLLFVTSTMFGYGEKRPEGFGFYHKSEVSQSSEYKPIRLATVQEKVQWFIEAVRMGDCRAFERADYDLLEGYYIPGKGITVGVIPALYVKAKENGRSITDELTNADNDIRNNVVEATLCGLYNRDPRVRLVAINFLRRLRPDETMQRKVKRAIALETVTTMTPKFREKDIDIPNIENPRLGWFTHVNDWSEDKNSLNVVRHDDGWALNGSYLNGVGAGDWLVNGLYQMKERNDYRVRNYYELDYRTGVKTPYSVWSKFSLLRYGADEQASGWEHMYKPFENGTPLATEQNPVEEMPRYRYLYIDSRDPETGERVETLYDGYHSVWEELHKLDQFITRVVWTNKIKSGDLTALRIVSKDTFRTMADQIDGESLEKVPTKSDKIFDESDLNALIVGLLENKVVSTREELARLVKNIFNRANTSEEAKELIRNALKYARHNENMIDVIRGRHLYNELVPPRRGQQMDYPGELDEIDTTRSEVTPEKFERLRDFVERPEESVIIYYDRRKPGADEEAEEGEAEEGEGAEAEEGETEGEEEEEKEAEEEAPKEEAAPPAAYKPAVERDRLYEGTSKDGVGHPLLNELEFRTLSYDVIDKWVSDNLSPKTERTYDDAKYKNTYLQGKTFYGEDPIKARRIEKAISGWVDLAKGNGAALQKASFYELQNSVLMGIKSAHDNGLTFLEVFIHNIGSQQGKADASAQTLELLYGESARNIEKKVKEGLDKKEAEAPKAPVEPPKEEPKEEEKAEEEEEGEEEEATEGEGEEDAPADELAENAEKKLFNVKSRVPGDIYATDKKLTTKLYPDYSKDPKDLARRDASEDYPYGQFYYGHGRGGYLGRYDDKVHLVQAENLRGVYFIPKNLRSAHTKAVNGLLQALEDKDPQKRLLVIHLLRRLVPGPEMLPQVTKILREMETVDKRRYRYIDTVSMDLTLDEVAAPSARTAPAAGGGAVAPDSPLKVQEKVVGDELIKLQRFIVRRILVNKIRSAKDAALLRDIPKGTFLTLVVRVDAEWDPWRIPLRSWRSWGSTGDDRYFFFRPEDIFVIEGGLDNRNFIVQRECANWIVNFYEYNSHDAVKKILRPSVNPKTLEMVWPDYGVNIVREAGSSRTAENITKQFVIAMRKAEAKDIVFFERNYLTIEGKLLIGRPQYLRDFLEKDDKGNNKIKTNPLTGKAFTDDDFKRAYESLYNTALPKGRVAVPYGTRADEDVFKQIDADRKIVQPQERDATWKEYWKKRKGADGSSGRNEDVKKYKSTDLNDYDTQDPELERYKGDYPYQRSR